jgi:hypothetical protein
MKVAVFFIGIAIVLASCSNEEPNITYEPSFTEQLEQNESTRFALLRFDAQIIDLGKMVTFDTEKTILFSNEGNEPLLIDKIVAEQDGVEIRSFTYEIMPGETGRLRIKVDPDLPQQQYLVPLTIYSNSSLESNSSQLELKFELTNQLSVGGIFISENDRVNVRMFPSTEATVLFGLNKGDAVTCVGAMHKEYVEAFDSDLWFYVDYNGRKGWILSALTSFEASETMASLLAERN